MAKPLVQPKLGTFGYAFQELDIYIYIYILGYKTFSALGWQYYISEILRPKYSICSLSSETKQQQNGTIIKKTVRVGQIETFCKLVSGLTINTSTTF